MPPLYRLLSLRYVRHRWDRATLVVGAGIVGRRVARRLIEEPELGLRPVAFLDDDPREGDSVTAAIPVRPLSDDLEDLVSRHRISHVIVAFSTAGHDELLRVSRRCWELGLSLSVVPRLFEIEGGRVSTEHLGGLPLIELHPSDPRGWQFRVKYAIDRVVSAIDELPQLWNVCRGDMSLIGPRPERAAYVRQFSPDIYRYTDRHRVKSGLTGWAQIHGLRGATSLADRVEWDNHYIENWSLWMDLKIAMRTVPAVLRATWTVTEN